jgi:hypothetical protein
MTAAGGLSADLRRERFAIVGALAVICALVFFAVAADRAWQQSTDPDSLAVEQCGGAVGGAPPGAPDTSGCYLDAVARSPVEAAGWPLVGGIAATVVVAGSVIASRRNTQPR